MGNLHCPTLIPQFLDDDGAPLSGGKLYTYEAGTTTLLATYTTQSGSTPHANPIVLNSRGEPSSGIFLDADSYKFVLYDSDDNLIWTLDNITVRDIETEHDALVVRVEDLEDAIVQTGSPGTVANRVSSGTKSDNSSIARYLVPLATSNEVKILATTTNLVYYVDSTQYTLALDTTISGLTSPPTSNNTALVNDSALSDDNFTKQLGEFGSAIPIDTIGSEISALNGMFAAFKIAGVATEYFIAKIDSTNGLLTEAMRGCFYDLNEDPIEASAFSNNDTITLMKLTWLFLKSSGATLATYNKPIYSTTEPTSPSVGDIYYNLTDDKFYRYTSTTWEDIEAVFIGVCIQDENGNTVASRPADFFADVKEDNTFEIDYESAIQIKSKSRYNTINVYGTKLIFNEAKITWDITTDLEIGQTEAASTQNYCYIKEDGDRIISQTAPYDRRGDLRGFYHPYEAWRYVGHVYNNASSNFDQHLVVNSPEVKNLIDTKQIKVGESYNIGLKPVTTNNTNDTIRITSRDWTPLSPSNPGYVCIADVVSGKAKVFKVTANVDMLLTGMNPGLSDDVSDYAISFYAINNDGVLTWGYSAIPNHKLISGSDDSATQAGVTQVNHFFVKSALTADAQCVEVGWAKCDFDFTGGAAELLWEIQTGDGDINLGICPLIWKPAPSAEGVFITAVTTAPEFGTVVVNELFWRRNNENWEFTFQYSQSDAVGAAAGVGSYLINLLSGLVISSKFTLNASAVDPQIFSVAEGTIDEGANPAYLKLIVYNSTQLFGLISNPGQVNIWSNAFYAYNEANFDYCFTGKVPIEGWDN